MTTTTTHRARVLYIGCALACATSVQTVNAQNSGAGQSSALEEIIVTAQKREQNLQNVPVAVTALSSDMLEKFRVTAIADIAGLAPNFQIITQGIQAIPIITIRGISSGVSDSAVDPKVGLYLDGVYIGRSVGAIFDIADIERVEVLRGPQGTLFGRNATGGAISLITAAPRGEFGLRQDLSVGNFDAWRTRTTLDLPAWGNLALKFTYLHDDRGGMVDNLIGGHSIDLRQRDPRLGVLEYEDELGSRDVDAFMAAARLQASDELMIDYRFDYTDSETVAYPTQQLGIIDGTPLEPLLEFVYSLQPGYGGITNLSPKRLDRVAAATSVQPLTVEGHNLTLSWDLAEGINLKSITAYREVDQEPNIFDLAGTGGWKLGAAQLAGMLSGDYGAIFDPANAPGPNDFFFNLLTARSMEQEQFTQELQLTVTRDRYDLVAGLFYFDEESPVVDALGIMQPVTNGVVVPAWYDGVFGSGTTESEARNESRAVYAQATWHTTEKLDLTAGIRYTEDERETELIQIAAATGSQLQPGTYGDDFSKSSYALIADYWVTEDVMAYLKFSTGFVSGGIMSGIPYKPEELESWETGIKSQFLDNRLRLNAVAFFMDFTDLQVQTFVNGSQRFDNAGEAEIKGLEIEVDAVPVDGLTLGGTFGWTDHEFKEYLLPPYGDIADYGHQAWTPKRNARLSAQYDFPAFAIGGNAFVRLDGRYRSRAEIGVMPTFDPAIDKVAYSESHWIVDARAGVAEIPLGKTAVSVSAWAKNLLNEDEVIVYGATVINQMASYAPERTYGLDLSLRL